MAEKPTSNRFLGDSVWRTVVKLVIASIIVGAIFSFLGLGVVEFWEGIFKTVRNMISAIGESFGEIALNLATYLLIGAAIVVPVWLIMRLVRSRK